MQTFRDLYAHRHIVQALTAKELKAQYRSMTLGFLWALLNPLVMVVVLSFVWIVFWGAGLEKPPFIVATLIPYNFFSYSLNGCAGCILGNSPLVKKVAFPRQILPVSVILNYLVHFGIQSILVVLVLVCFPTEGTVIGWQLLWLPVLLAVLIGLSTGLGLLVSSLSVVYRDTTYIVQSLLTIAFWVSPVIYDPGERFPDLPDWFEYAYYCNPLAGILDSFRAVLFFGTSPNLLHLGMAVAVTVTIGVIGVRTFWIHEKQFADLIR